MTQTKRILGTVLATILLASGAGAAGLTGGLATPYPAPMISGIKGWINSPPLAMQGLKGKVVLVDFWTYSCVNCVRTLPYLIGWDKKYRDKGLVIIGMHAPEFAFEKDRANVEHAVKQRGITYPVALDSDLVTWGNFHNQYWPAQYLIDQNGNVVYTHFGEGADDITENNIRTLLGMKGDVAADAKQPDNAPQTPETYLGYARSQRYGGDGNTVSDAVHNYAYPASLPADQWALSGNWTVGEQQITADAAGASLRLHFTAGKVFLVMGTKDGKPVTAKLALNGKPLPPVTVDRHTLYPLVSQKASADGVLEITAAAPGLEAYAFTFGG